ncbi:MAG: M20 family metallo-hydrolase [Beijerinckiaceae bacterium]
MTPNLTIDSARLWDTLHETAQFGATKKGGVRRLTLTQEDKAVRDWLKVQAQAIGCTLTIDAAGNMFVHRAGRDSTKAPIAFGSHLDTQPTGGKYDGILGVLAGLEVLRTLHAVNYETDHPLVLVNWTDEEGSRFSPAMLGSGVYAGIFDQPYADTRVDPEGVTFAQAIEAIGYRGSDAPPEKFDAYFELHIEQGPILEAENRDIGVVTLVQGIYWLDIALSGADAHAGTTPMHRRKDALAAAAELMNAIETVPAQVGSGVATVGTLAIANPSRNVIPGDVTLTVDLRNPDNAKLAEMRAQVEQSARNIAARRGVAIEVRDYWHSPVVPFHADAIACVRAGAAKLGLTTEDIFSGAGHDAAYVAKVCPTAMIFTPCKDGVSHNEAEEISFKAAADGGQILLEAILQWDQRGNP